ncbi:hypothetical protein Hanom_Chr09g00860691 [Helianthus anomalus]
MNRIPGFVGFIHDNLSQIGPLGEPNSVQIIEYPIGFVYQMSSVVIYSLSLQRPLIKASMLGFAD